MPALSAIRILGKTSLMIKNFSVLLLKVLLRHRYNGRSQLVVDEASDLS